jgi:hypothetical protein
MKSQLRVLALSWAVIAGAAAVLLTSSGAVAEEPPGCCENAPLPRCELVSWQCTTGANGQKFQTCNWFCPGYVIP